MGQNTSKKENLNNKMQSSKTQYIDNKKPNKSNKVEEKNNSNNSSQNSDYNNKTVNVSLSNIKCKYCDKNYIPNKVLRSHLFYCVDCYLKKKI